MPVGVIDVGSNTVRVLVARGARTVFTERVMLRLGADVERHGRILPEKLDTTAETVSRLAREARAAGAEALEVLVTSPGRQAENADELIRKLEEAARCPVRVLSAADEARLAFLGATADASPPPGRLVAVVDTGGGSAQVAVGTRRGGPHWVRSIDIGSQRLTSRLLTADPPGADALAAARTEVDRYLEGFDPPAPRTAFAVGGSARALKRIRGSRLDGHDFDELLALLAVLPTSGLVERYGIDGERVRTLAAGCVILAALQRRLGVPLKVARAGLRDGALTELADKRLAA